MRLSALAGLVVGLVIGAAVAVACTPQRRAKAEREIGTEPENVAGEAPESAAESQPTPAMH